MSGILPNIKVQPFFWWWLFAALLSLLVVCYSRYCWKSQLKPSTCMCQNKQAIFYANVPASLKGKWDILSATQSVQFWVVNVSYSWSVLEQITCSGYMFCISNKSLQQRSKANVVHVLTLKLFITSQGQFHLDSFTKKKAGNILWCSLICN